MEKVKIVIADDSKVNNDLICLYLKEDERVEVVGIAEDGVSEYNLIKKLKPEIVITDNQMPNMTGLEVINKINGENLEKKPAFFMISGDTFNDLDKEKLNIIGILGKPVNYGLLKNLIDDFIESKDINIIHEQDKKRSKISSFFKLFNN